MGKPGIAFLRELVAGEIPAAPIQATLGFELTEVGDGFAKAELIPGEHLYSAFNAVHGGVVATLLDSVMTAAAVTTLDALTVCTTATLSVHLT
ncbi:MAG TPA: PaaI family thioesterase, partial [Polyangiaceae bacterium]|nr:PaaI family thioesterase [Polyangiaceae bacterium]